MDRISDMLPPVLLEKLDNTAKDRNSKNQHYKITTSAKLAESDEESTDKKALFVSKSSTWTETDRRSTNDRRRQIGKRGRWLESRNSIDRRKVKQAISITI